MTKKFAVKLPETTKGQSSRKMIWLMSLVVILFIAWSSIAPLDQIVRGPGRVVPSTNTQVIQNLEGGILSELRVSEGKIVEKGEVLARLHEERFRSEFSEMETQVVSLEARLERLKAELALDDSFTLPNEILDSAPEVAASEIQLFEAKTADFKNSKQALRESLALHRREVELLETSVSRKIAPEIDLVNAKQAESDIRTQLTQLEREFVTTRAEEYAQTIAELNQARANLKIAKDQLSRTTLYAPTKGIVNKVNVTTIGGVAPPGETILELTPLNEDLRIEAEILPRDVAFVFPNMRATIKLTAYDYTIYGSFDGRVVHVSADTFEKENTREAEPYYKVLIALDNQNLKANGEEIEIRPGMLAEAELHVGEQTVLQYLLKPLFKASQAFREP